MRTREFVLFESLPPMGWVRSPNKHDPLKNPLRTFNEISDMLGINKNQLSALMLKNPGFPSAVPAIGKQGGRGRNNYYELRTVIQWIKNNNIQDKIKNWKSANQLVDEHFADGKIKGKSRPGRVKRAGASCKGSITDLRARARKYGGEQGKMYQWCLNMKAGRQKSK